MRYDISTSLIHFTKDYMGVTAYNRFKSIVSQRVIVGGTGNIKGLYTCICFSESPLQMIPNGLVNPTSYSKYSKFGFMFDKASAFQAGARPVIYQSDSELELLDTSIRWRHMRLELGKGIPTDFLWEREWRLRQDNLPIHPDFTHLVFPNPEAHLNFVNEYHREHQLNVIGWLQSGNPSAAAQYQAYWLPFPWICHCLNPLTWNLPSPSLPPLAPPYYSLLPTQP